MLIAAGSWHLQPPPDTHPAFVANSPEPGQLRTATRSFPAVWSRFARLPAPPVMNRFPFGLTGLRCSPPMPCFFQMFASRRWSPV